MNRRITLLLISAFFTSAAIALSAFTSDLAGHPAHLLAIADFLIVAVMARMWLELAIGVPNLMWLCFTIAAIIPGTVLTLAGFNVITLSDKSVLYVFVAGWALTIFLGIFVGRTGLRFDSWLRKTWLSSQE